MTKSYEKIILNNSSRDTSGGTILVTHTIFDKMESGKICIPITEYIIGDKTSDDITVKTRMKSEEGAFGEIWQACEKGNCRYILKYQKFRDENEKTALPAITAETIRSEINLQKKFSDLKLAPRVKDSWLCESGGVIVMAALKQTVYSLFKIYDDINIHYMILAECLNLIRNLHESGYYHGDASISNIMVNYSKDDMEDAEEEDDEIQKYKIYDYKYYFIDMGLSGYIDNENRKERIANDYQIFSISIQDKYENDVNKGKTKENFSHLMDFMSAYTRNKK